MGGPCDQTAKKIADDPIWSIIYLHLHSILINPSHNNHRLLKKWFRNNDICYFGDGYRIGPSRLSTNIMMFGYLLVS